MKRWTSQKLIKNSLQTFNLFSLNGSTIYYRCNQVFSGIFYKPVTLRRFKPSDKIWLTMKVCFQVSQAKVQSFVAWDDIIDPKQTWFRCANNVELKSPACLVHHRSLANDSQTMSGECLQSAVFSLWSTSNNHLHFENENITVDGFTAQLQARLSWSDVIVVEKSCPHRLRFFGANYCGRMYVESFCNRLMWLGYNMSGQCTRKSGKLSLTETCNCNFS